MASGQEVVRGRWAPDPIGKHEFRWHDDTSWTGWVTDANRQSFDPMASAPGSIRSKAFESRRDALKRLFIGITAFVLGISVAVVTASSDSSIVIILPYGACIYGLVEVARSVRYLTRGRQPVNVPTTPAPPRVDFRAEIGVLDDLLRRGKLSQHSYDLAAIKLRRKHNVAPPT